MTVLPTIYGVLQEAQDGLHHLLAHASSPAHRQLAGIHGVDSTLSLPGLRFRPTGDLGGRMMWQVTGRRCGECSPCPCLLKPGPTTPMHRPTADALYYPCLYHRRYIFQYWNTYSLSARPRPRCSTPIAAQTGNALRARARACASAAARHALSRRGHGEVHRCCCTPAGAAATSGRQPNVRALPSTHHTRGWQHTMPAIKQSTCHCDQYGRAGGAQCRRSAVPQRRAPHGL